MMTKRSFIGAMATIAVPRFADEMILQQKISGQTFDLRGLAWVGMHSNTFKCCRFIVDDTSVFITLEDNAFSSCQFEGFETADFIALNRNIFYNCGPIPLGRDCKPPRGLSNKAYGNERLEDGPADECELPVS